MEGVAVGQQGNDESSLVANDGNTASAWGSQICGDVTVTLLSIVPSGTGCTADFLVSLPRISTELVDHIHLLLTVTDNVGDRYESRRWWGSRITADGRTVIRRLMIFSPALDPRASELRIEIEAIVREKWEEPKRPGTRSRGRLIELEPLRGPWSFTVTLPFTS